MSLPKGILLPKGLCQRQSSVNLSVNSHYCKRRVSLNSLLSNSVQETKLNGEVMENLEGMGYSVRNDNPNQITKFASRKNSSECELKPTIPSPSAADVVDTSLQFPSLSLNQQSQIFCSLCKSPLSCPETNPYVMCCLTSLSKAVFASFSQGKGQQGGQASGSVARILVVDISSVDQRLCSRDSKTIPGQGIWRPEDGCVYNSIFCPFCISPNHCLGFQIVAADASNFQLINKILFYYDCLDVKTDTQLEKKDASRESGSHADVAVDIHSFEKYTYLSPQQSSGGWRMTKSKSRLPRRRPSLQC